MKTVITLVFSVNNSLRCMVKTGFKLTTMFVKSMKLCTVDCI